MEAFINGNRTRKTFFAKMAIVPKFLRFNEIRLDYESCSESIEEKSDLIESSLAPFSDALKGSKSVQFHGTINGNNRRDRFSNHPQLVNYLRERLLPICNSSRAYHFFIRFFSDKEKAATNVISSILQFPQIKRCSNLFFWFYYLEDQKQLPVEAISSWLIRKLNDGMEVVGIREEIFLTIRLDIIQSAVEICDHLEAVIGLFYSEQQIDIFVFFIL